MCSIFVSEHWERFLPVVLLKIWVWIGRVNRREALYSYDMDELVLEVETEGEMLCIALFLILTRG
jgi:hypothetical protein